MTDNASSLPDSIKEAASDWLLRMGSQTATEQAAFERWCAEDPRHEEAFRRFEAIWRDTATLTDLRPLIHASDKEKGPLSRLTPLMQLGAQARIWAAASVAIVLGCVLAVRNTTPPYHFETRIGEIRELTLSDGSHITLSARSSVDVHLSNSARGVSLTAGEAFFSIAHDPNRPFTVKVGDKEIRVVGTKFDVRRVGEDVRVSVLEGTVQMNDANRNYVLSDSTRSRASLGTNVPSRATDDAGSRRILTAGQEVQAIIGGSIESPQSTGAVEPGAWRHGRLIYVDTTLREIVADINRFSTQQVSIEDARAGNQRVSVTFAPSEIVAMLNGLPNVLPVEIAPVGEALILRSKQPKTSVPND